MKKYADIIVDISHESIDKTFQYEIPEDLQEAVTVGSQVEIPFGNRKKMTGFVVGLSLVPKIDESRIKSVIAVSGKTTTVDGTLLELAWWMRSHFGGTMNECLKTVLPVKKVIKQVEKKDIVLKVDKEEAERQLDIARNKKYVAKARLLAELILIPRISQTLVTERLNVSSQTINAMVRQGIIGIESEVIDRNGDYSDRKVGKLVPLNSEQQQVFNAFSSDYDSGVRKTYLLFGVTGSGKTEVYLEMIEKVINSGKQAIVLIPEISLTFQTVLRFTKRFGNRVAFFNSRLSEGERYDQFLKAKKGEIDIMIGPRSALFAPFSNLGLIVIDEEHEGSYKSEQAPKYHARDVALELARMTGASVVLGSATPSVESYTKALNGEYTLFKLENRAKGQALPQVSVVDLKEELKNKNKTIFSVKLVNSIAERLEKQEQVILFLNRRGYSGFVSCRSCGKAIECPHCSISLTQHFDGTLKCHLCGYEIKMPKKCPSCESPYIAGFGTGTQKIEEGIGRLFPQAKVLRMDADTTKDKKSHENILSAFANEEADILIGTQMIVKGHDFPKVTLVGILAADLSLHASDYRSSEKTFQLLAQAAGRAGRGELPGEVIIQTYEPEHYAITTASKQDYEEFYRTEIAYRKLLHYPPVGHLLAVMFWSTDEDKCRKYCENCASGLIKNKDQVVKEGKLQMLGPVKAGISKANDFFRNLIYFKSEDYDILIDLVEELEEKREIINKAGVMFSADFDPMSSY